MAIGILGCNKGCNRRAGLPVHYQLSAHDDAAFGKSDLLAYLHHPVPARGFYGGAYEVGADVAFAQIVPVD